MYAILTEDVPQLGQKNHLVRVADGYFNNFLAPRGFAKRATASLIESMRESIETQKKNTAQKAKVQHDGIVALEGKSVEFARKTSDKGTLFKGVSAKDVAKSITDELSVKVSDSDITMEPLKTVGDHEVTVSLGGETAQVKVVITATEE
ncbi:MAG: 50S ribosomal protein L9 [Candidatus Gracilibacteria bacterium]|nr:50S ribosomal protein L9 [Candidatus Gracilibacteria bacterium]